ncbi:hypothetical protein AB9K34_04915 [Sedimentitalea sp. XS_ASV28]|uniref:hypothetical protein n=1 Tax=Sedimentitalea sp. XS_ASV28 TaxID=3241296 RepID=UPI0035147A1D
MKPTDGMDPKGLIYEAYQIEEISGAECRSIFLDWALSLPEGHETAAALHHLIERYADALPDHPMSAVLRDGLTSVVSPRRRGGWRSRPRN